MRSSSRLLVLGVTLVLGGRAIAACDGGSAPSPASPAFPAPLPSPGAGDASSDAQTPDASDAQTPDASDAQSLDAHELDGASPDGET
ncbi:MAG: hypothetical protein U0183_20205 [Polyangiaceae bacterium]